MLQTHEEPDRDAALLAPLLKRLPAGWGLAFMAFRESCSTVRSCVRSIAMPATLIGMVAFGGPPIVNAILKNWPQLATQTTAVSATTTPRSTPAASPSGTNPTVVSKADSAP